MHCIGIGALSTCHASIVDAESEATDSLSAAEWERWFEEAGDRQLRELLYWRWDPLAISDVFPVTRSEYERYADELGGLLAKGSAPADLEAALLDAEERMGLATAPGAEKQRRETLALILKWRSLSIRLWRDHRGLRDAAASSRISPET
jgi:hypothetical protein